MVSGANSTWEKSDSEDDSEIRIRLDSESEDEILVASEDDPTWEMLDSEIMAEIIWLDVLIMRIPSCP